MSRDGFAAKATDAVVAAAVAVAGADISAAVSSVWRVDFASAATVAAALARAGIAGLVVRTGHTGTQVDDLVLTDPPGSADTC